MNMQRVVALLLSLGLSVLSAKELVWQTGKVVEISTERFGVGDTGKLNVLFGNAHHPTHDKGVQYTIQAGDYSYVAMEMSMAHHRLKDERAALNDTVRFALEGETKLILMGSDGKEHTLQLMRRVARSSDAGKP